VFWSGGEKKEVSSLCVSLKTKEGTGICKRMSDKKINIFCGKTGDEYDL
jgi:hypothetical protein